MRRELRPKERLLRHGPAAVTDAELLAVLLRNGSPGTSALDAAERVLRDVGGISALVAADRHTLSRSVVGDGRAAVILAAAELFRRITSKRVTGRRIMRDPGSIASYIAVHFMSDEQEIMGALYLDARYRLITAREIFRGTVGQASVQPAPILSEALRQGAASFLLWHCHPSGDPSPSGEDLSFTRRMAEAGELLGVTLVDHLIVGSAGRWTSLRRRRAW